MENLKRLEVKYVRDKAKGSYPGKPTEGCRICGSNILLQYHHFSGLTNLWNRFKAKNKVRISSVEDIETYRDQFIASHDSEINNNGVYLCKAHHSQLHSIYGKSPNLATSKKQRKWVEIQREKYNELVD